MRHPEVGPAKAIQLLEAQLRKGEGLLELRPLSSDAKSQWELVTRNILEKAFGRNSPNVSSVIDAGRVGSFPLDASETWWEHRRAETLQTQLTRLQGLIELLETELQLANEQIITPTARASGHRVFLVHGHDDGTLQLVARFLEQLDQDVIVLREQPSKGRTIIEKFEDFADVGFAIVLLTADDRGGTREQPFDQQQARARQNVVMELGYFLGRLGRTRVCALHESGVEIPSDYSGVLYVPLDDRGAWRLELARELKAAGLPIDMNKAL